MTTSFRDLYVEFIPDVEEEILNEELLLLRAVSSLTSSDKLEISSFNYLNRCISGIFLNLYCTISFADIDTLQI